MAETVTDSASNGTKLDDVKADEPVKEVVVGAAELGDKAASAGDLKPVSTKVVQEKVAEDTPPVDSSIKPVTATKSSDEAVAQETSGLEKADAAEPADVKEDLKTSAEVNSGKTNAQVPQADPELTKDRIDTKPKEEKEIEVEKEAEAIAFNSSEQKEDAVVEEGKPEAMDIDDKKQEKIEARVEPRVERQAEVVVTPKKKLGRPKKIRGPEGPKVEQKTPASETKKRPRQKKEPVTPLSAERDRPARERKSIERFVASVEKDKKKELVIKQGTGTALMDIPNVAFKLSKRSKGDEILNMLHSLLYNKRAKATVIKYNIFRFSGYVWTENEEKERNKVREKLERFTKEGLGQLIDVLDLHLNKTGKKEELVGKVLEFLESPHKTTEVSIEEREQRLKEKKRKGRTPGRGRGPGRKRHKPEDYSTSKKRGRRKKNETDEETEGDYANSDDESLEEEEEVERKRLTFIDDHDDGEEDDANDEDYDAKKKPQKRPGKPSKEEDKEPAEVKVSNDDEESEGDQTAKRSAVKSTSSASMKSPMPSSPDITRSSSKPAEKVYTKGSRKKSKEVKEKEKEKEKEKPTGKRLTKQKPISKEKNVEKLSGRGRGRGKAKEKEPPFKKKKTAEIPSDEVLQNEIRDLLKDLSAADFSKVTFMDIVVQLAEKFDVDLSVKKGHVKSLIQQELSRLANEVEEEDEDQEAEEGADVEVEPEGEVTDTTEAAEKTETPEAEEAAEQMEVEGAGADSDIGDSAKDVETEAEAADEEATEGPSKAEESTDVETKDQQTAAVPETTVESGGD